VFENEAYMGLADFHQYHPSKQAIQESDLILMIGARLDNQMNFGNTPFFPVTTNLVCINGSHEELDYNRAADQVLLSDPGAFLQELIQVEQTWVNWFDLQKNRRAQWVLEWSEHIAEETLKDARIHPLQLSLDVQKEMGEEDWLVFDGGNTHFWSEIAVNIAGWNGQKLGGIMHPGNYSLLGVGVSFGVSAKNLNPDKNVVVISGDGAFLSANLLGMLLL
jgi:acetolactate synthase-1/2/3 large subunit